MVTTTTKTLNWTGDSGSLDKSNTVNATITSTPGFNGGYLSKLPGLLKLLALVLTTIALGLAASLRHEERLHVLERMEDQRVIANGSFTYPKELFMSGEVFFLCAHAAVLTCLMVFLLSYLFHTVSSMLAPKATTLEVVALPLLGLLMLVAGIVEIVQTEMWKTHAPEDPYYRLMSTTEVVTSST